VDADSQGKVKVGPGTLYGSIGRMTEAALVRESNKRVDPELDDERRIYYELTGAGRASRADATGSGMRCCCGCVRGHSVTGSPKRWHRHFTTCGGSKVTPTGDRTGSRYGSF
jgi:DNA-binding PadR family transcriptional regulator